jgi:putative spermidine/putrescine transport system permease protein
LPLVAVAGLFVVYPLVRVFMDSLGDVDPTVNYLKFFSSEVYVRTLWLTIVLSILVTLIAVALGAVLAWIMRTTTSRLLRILCWAAVLVPFWMSVVVKNYSFTLLLGRRGLLNRLLEWVFGEGAMLELLYTNTAVVIGMLYSMLPYAVLPLFVTFLTINPEIPLAAQTLGASRMQAIRTTVLPLALPGMVATSSIVFVITIGFYITPVLLGGPRSTFMASLINEQTFTLFNYPGAATSAVVLIVVAILTLAVAIRAVGIDRLKRALI